MFTGAAFQNVGWGLRRYVTCGTCVSVPSILHWSEREDFLRGRRKQLLHAEATSVIAGCLVLAQYRRVYHDRGQATPTHFTDYPGLLAKHNGISGRSRNDTGTHKSRLAISFVVHSHSCVARSASCAKLVPALLTPTGVQ